MEHIKNLVPPVIESGYQLLNDVDNYAPGPGSVIVYIILLSEKFITTIPRLRIVANVKC